MCLNDQARLEIRPAVAAAASRVCVFTDTELPENKLSTEH
jgi:hypothetical protein